VAAPAFGAQCGIIGSAAEWALDLTAALRRMHLGGPAGPRDLVSCGTVRRAHVQLGDLPPFALLQTAFARAGRGRAAGLDAMPAECLANAGRWGPAAFFPL